MIDVIQIAPDYEAAEEALNNLISQADEASASLEQSSNKLQEGLEEDLGTINSSLEGFLSGLGEASQATNLINSVLVEMAQQNRTDMEEHRNAINEHKTSNEEARQELIEEVAESRQRSSGAGAECVAVIESAKDLIGVVTEGLETAEGKTEEIIDQFTEAVESFRDLINEGGETASEGFEQLITAVADELREASESIMDQLGDAIDDFTETAGGGIEMMQGIAEDGFANFEETFRGLGEDLESRATEILSELASHIAETASGEISEIVQGVIGDAISKVTSEIAEAIALTQIGASTTAALSPILPQLAAAKAVVGAIEKALALLDAIF